MNTLLALPGRTWPSLKRASKALDGVPAFSSLASTSLDEAGGAGALPLLGAHAAERLKPALALPALWFVAFSRDLALRVSCGKTGSLEDGGFEDQVPESARYSR